jgi:hypothetical protein
MDFKNVDEVLNAYAEYVVDSAKKNLVDERKSLGDLYKSVSYKYEKSQDLFLLDFLMEDYGTFVDKGVKGKTSTYPETSAALSQFQYGSGNFPKGGLRDGIKGWLEKKRFQWRDKKGKFMSYDTMTYLISRSIYNKGLKANLFFTTPFELGLQNLPKQLTDAFSLDIENAIILGTKK